ncbi:hypothetical protein KBZ21_40715, partial [Streptomyces sp. A73]|nr:hypothetical protein [Streptomyces sp. A73]
QVTAGLLGGEQRFEFGDAGFQAGENVSHTRGRHGGHYEGGAGDDLSHGQVRLEAVPHLGLKGDVLGCQIGPQAGRALQILTA